MAKTITSANSIFTLAIASLIPAPVQLQGFTADDIFDAETLEAAEVQMGVDGKLSAGFVYSPLSMNVSLQADSDSILLFDTWYEASQRSTDIYFAHGTIVLPSLALALTLTRGVLRSYSPMPSAKKVLQPRTFGLVWESIKRSPA